MPIETRQKCQFGKPVSTTILSDEANYHRINEYIATNPASWETDKFYNAGY